MSAGERRPSTFAPGSSGNLRGRPRKATNVGAIILAELNQKHVVTENGRRRRVSKLALNAKQIANKGASGELRAAKMTVDLAMKVSEREGAVPSRPVLTESDREIVARFVARLRLTHVEETPNADA